ncbi:DNA/RNA helicase, superfamily II [Thiorhodovibrio frisius]|uniref:DNA/RNA helicase, superfamily II n=1 Tax=Thiorhodovibrio frisius TaxID=631362 RepID=H8Z728_9GAMM|nr:DNA/RNA helicase, superfamily II [Thiorhodovibrio frisius]WPL21879.1 ATP-dependent RNA helicase RhlB [Thiorhodovibrio frisius]
MSETHLTETRFDSFALDPRILDGLNEAGFNFCTPIQAQALPIALAGRDVAGQAQTGTGKTAAYLVAALHHLLRHPPDPAHPPLGPRVLILAPTRELAVQIHKDALVLAKHTGFRLGLAYGGTGYQQQRDEIGAGVDILIGTPGRLIDYFKQRVFDLKSISVVILDEADRMFDLGFIKDIRFVLRRMPPPEQRLGMLFSATLSYRVTELAYEHMNDPQMVEIRPDKVTADRVTQCCYMVGNDEKIPLLIGLLRGIDDGRVMVFINTKRQAELVWGYLEGNGIESAVLSGDVPQKQRLRLLRHFQEGKRRCWSPPTWPRAGCISPMSAMSSTTTCQKTPRTMSTALAAPRVPAPKATPLALSARLMPSAYQRLRTISAPKSLLERSATTCSPRSPPQAAFARRAAKRATGTAEARRIASTSQNIITKAMMPRETKTRKRQAAINRKSADVEGPNQKQIKANLARTQLRLTKQPPPAARSTHPRVPQSAAQTQALRETR